MATNTAASFTNHTGNGTAGPFAISFSYIKDTDVDVTVGGVLKTLSTHYTFTSATQITFTSGNEPSNGVAIKFQRDTNISAKAVDFQDGSVLTETDLDANTNQVLFSVQENLAKLSTIEEGATGDQTAAEIRTLVESATDSNVFTDADHTKLNAIESGATADQTNAEIKTAYEANSNTNAFTDAEKTKLTGIESNATADQTNAEIKTAYEANSDTNAFTDAEKTKLTNIESNATADQSDSEIKTAYENNSDTNAFTDAEKTKLSGIAANADVTSTKQIGDLSNVNTTGVADGKILKYQASSGNFIIADDGGGGGTSLTNGDKGDITVANAGTVSESFTIDNAAVTSAKIAGQAVTKDKTNFISTSSAAGLEIKGTSGQSEGYIQLNCAENSHGVKIKSPPHSAAQNYTLTLPSNIVNGQFLKTDANGNLSWAAVDLTALSASNLISGTIPDARFPATLPTVSGTNLTNLPSASLTGALPAISGAALTSLNATNLGSGTIPDARFPATLPAASAANLTAIPAANITGTLPAISAANLTNIPAANITGTLPAIDGSALTGIATTTGGGAIYENSATISASRTIPSGSNGMSAGPITIANNVILAISVGSVYTVV